MAGVTLAAVTGTDNNQLKAVVKKNSGGGDDNGNGIGDDNGDGNSVNNQLNAAAEETAAAVMAIGNWRR